MWYTRVAGFAVLSKETIVAAAVIIEFAIDNELRRGMCRKDKAYSKEGSAQNSLHFGRLKHA